MKTLALFVRSTILGGVIFLAPIVVLIVILAKRSVMQRRAYTALLFTFPGFRT
jgi:hypothetical protein